MSYVENCACDGNCGFVGTCLVVNGEFDEQGVYCADCVRLNEEMSDDIDDIDDDDFVNEHDMSFDPLECEEDFDYDTDEEYDRYGYDDDQYPEFDE